MLETLAGFPVCPFQDADKRGVLKVGILSGVAAVVCALLGIVGARRLSATHRIGICLLRGSCRPVRAPLGGFRCSDCDAVGADIGEFLGFQISDGYVNCMRGHKSLDRREFTRSSAWEIGEGGRW